MINAPLRERQFAQVLGFLDEQFGDSDVTIVFADVGNGWGCLYSNRQAESYKPARGIYTRECGPGFLARYEGFFQRGPEYFSEGSKKADECEALTGFRPPIAWVYSGRLAEVFLPHLFQSPLTYPLYCIGFPEDLSICHEAAHDVVRKHPEILADSGARLDIINEALPMSVTGDYIEQSYPRLMADYERFLQRQREPGSDIPHNFGAAMVLCKSSVLQETRDRIREANKARKALIS